MEKATSRQQVILRHLNPVQLPCYANDISASTCSYNHPAQSHERPIDSNDEVVIVSAYRTPICKGKRGLFEETAAEDLLTHVLKAVILTRVSPHEVGDIVVGSVLAPGFSRAAECRMAAFYAGFPETVPIKTVNRQCASGLQTIVDVAAAIKSGVYDIGIGAGVESMSLDMGAHKHTFNPQVQFRTCQQARDCLLPMGITSEIVAKQYAVSRVDQDKTAVLSHKKAAEAAAVGKFKDEITPVHTEVFDPKSGTQKSVIVSSDEGIRRDTSLSVLSSLRPSFEDGGTTTAGNSSQISDGAAAILLMKREVAVQKRLRILGVFRSFSAVGVNPAVMGIGPAFAIPAAIEAARLKLDDIDLFAINEAFASQYVCCLRMLGLDSEKVNVNGGAIALGHPVGATGARCVATLLHEMKSQGKNCRYGVVSMCMGSGMGAAAVFESMHD